MTIKGFLYPAAVVAILFIMSGFFGGCAQVGTPTGGPRDSIPPVLISAVPKLYQTDFTGDKITIHF